ncbi:SUN domain-containing protein 5-like, partial [Petaurus breviceps papuanus]|uniref:SUN domain-containing protein 5-like n=1 Tax=Petaurus breviceps papuanus TaxID=3040969 RepID=UPI0036DC5B1C
EDTPQIVTIVISPSYRSVLSWLIQIICFISTLRNTVCKAQLCPQYIGWTQTGAAPLKNFLHKLVKKLSILFFCVFAFWCIVICLPTILDTGRVNMRAPDEVKVSISSLNELRHCQEKVRKHAEEIQALYSLMKQLSAKIQEVKVMSNEELVAQNIMKKIQGDYIEKPDYALKSIGGTIDFEHTSATYSCDKARSYWSWLRLWNCAHPPDVILEGIDDKSKETFLGDFLFQPENSIQMFPLKNTLIKPFKCIKLKILSNWGNPHFTCLYRVRAHGTVSQPLPEY